MVETIKKNHKTIIKYVVVGLVLLSVLITAGMLIKAIWGVDLQTYMVYEATTEPTITQEAYEKDFLCVGSQMESIQIEAVVAENTSGNVSYQIIDADGAIVVEATKSIAEMQNEAQQVLFIDVSKLGLEQGQRYTVFADFKETENLSVVLGSGNILLRQYFHFPYKVHYTIGIVGLFAAGLFWLYMVYKKGLTAKIFLVTSLVVGIIVIFMMPPMSRDDEYRHFIRAYTEAVDYADIELKLPDGDEAGIIGTMQGEEYIATVPYEINELRLMDFEANYNGYGYHQEVNNRFCIEKFIATLKAEPVEETYEVSAVAVATRGSVYYWPQEIAMKVAALFGTNDLFMFYIARFGQLLACVLMEAIAIYIAPKTKEMVWLLAFIPNALLLKASCNCDGLLISEMILLTSIVVWFKEEKIDILSLKGLVGIVAYVILAGDIIEMKIPYIIVCAGLLIYLGKDNFKKILEIIKKYKKVSIGVGISVLLIGIIGFILIDKTIFLNLIYAFVPQPHLIYIIENPGYIAKLFILKWFELVRNLFAGMKGSNLVPYPILVVFLLMLLKKRQHVIKRAYFAVLFAGMIMLIVLVGYIMTPPDYGQIWGVTYRYLLPFMMMGALCLPAGNDKTDAIAQKCIPLVLFAITIMTVMSWSVGWSV